MNSTEKAWIEGKLMIWVPEGSTKTIKQILAEPLDAIYIVRKQTEREKE